MAHPYGEAEHARVVTWMRTKPGQATMRAAVQRYKDHGHPSVQYMGFWGIVLPFEFDAQTAADAELQVHFYSLESVLKAERSISESILTAMMETDPTVKAVLAIKIDGFAGQTFTVMPLAESAACSSHKPDDVVPHREQP